MTKLSEIYIRTKQDLIRAVEEVGFLPLFTNSLRGFSVEEHVDWRAWFSGEEGVWEWKGPVIQETGCAYGKFFEKKAAFISPSWFPDFANARRDGYDFDARFDDGLASYQDQYLYNLVAGSGPIVSLKLKELGNYRPGGRKGFETSMTRLQAQGYILIQDFQYGVTKAGKRYGWGRAVYSTPEQFMGRGFTDAVYQRTPEESREKILAGIREILPEADEAALRKLIGMREGESI